MDHLLTMKVSKGVAKVGQNPPALGEIPWMSGKPLVQSTPVDELHLDAVPITRKPCPSQDLADTGMLEGNADLILATKHTLIDGVFSVFRLQDLVNDHPVIAMPLEEQTVPVLRLMQQLKSGIGNLGHRLRVFEETGRLDHAFSCFCFANLSYFA